MEQNNELQELKRLRREKTLRRLCAENRDLIAPDDVALLISAAVPDDATGNPSLTAAGQELERLKLTKPYLYRSARQDSAMDFRGVPPPLPPSDEQLARQLFGKGSNSSAANRLAMSAKKRYLEIKAVAQQLGLIA
jgi:hypothetical protein